MIIGLGVDVCSVERIGGSLRRFGDRFWRRILCEAEQARLGARVDRAMALAGRFAVKEAAIKALAGAPGVGWHHFEVCGGVREPPQLLLHGPARRLADDRGIDRIHVSITHDAGVAAAVVIMEGRSEAS